MENGNKIKNDAETWFDAAKQPENIFQDEAHQNKVGNDIYNQLLASIDKNTKSKHQLRIWISSAAAIFLITALSLVLFKAHFFGFSQIGSNQNAQNWLLVSSTNSIRKIILPDQSVVYLNKKSAIKFPKIFAGKTRLVQLLKGEAYFEVFHNKSKAFIVNTGAINTVVLGTHFNIEQNENNHTIKVSLLEGSVLVDRQGVESNKLKPGQMLSYTKNNKMEVKPIATTDVTGWIKNKLIFNDISLKQALLKMEEYYNIHIVINNKNIYSETEHVTADFDKQSASSVLNAILMVHGYTYVQGKENTYVIN